MKHRILDTAIEDIIDFLDNAKKQDKMTNQDYKYNMDLTLALKNKILNDING